MKRKKRATKKKNLRKIASESSKYSLKLITLSAKILNFWIYLRIQLIHQLRQLKLKKIFIEKTEMTLINLLWNRQ